MTELSTSAVLWIVPSASTVILVPSAFTPPKVEVVAVGNSYSDPPPVAEIVPSVSIVIFAPAVILSCYFAISAFISESS